MIDPERKDLSVVRQCQLVSISRSAFYYRPIGESPLNLTLMRLIDEAFLEWPGRAPWPPPNGDVASRERAPVSLTMSERTGHRRGRPLDGPHPDRRR
jgi:hypothetical protein